MGAFLPQPHMAEGMRDLSGVPLKSKYPHSRGPHLHLQNHHTMGKVSTCMRQGHGHAVCGCCYSAAQSLLTLCDPRDCSPPGPSVHGVSPARIPEWVVISSFRGSSQALNLCLQHWQADSLPLGHLGNPGTLTLVLWALCCKISRLREIATVSEIS